MLSKQSLKSYFELQLHRLLYTPGMMIQFSFWQILRSLCSNWKSCFYFSLQGSSLIPPSTHSHQHLCWGRSRPGWPESKWTLLDRAFPQTAPTGKTTHGLITGRRWCLGTEKCSCTQECSRHFPKMFHYFWCSVILRSAQIRNMFCKPGWDLEHTVAVSWHSPYSHFLFTALWLIWHSYDTLILLTYSTYAMNLMQITKRFWFKMIHSEGMK